MDKKTDFPSFTDLFAPLFPTWEELSQKAPDRRKEPPRESAFGGAGLIAEELYSRPDLTAEERELVERVLTGTDPSDQEIETLEQILQEGPRKKEEPAPPKKPQTEKAAPPAALDMTDPYGWLR